MDVSKMKKDDDEDENLPLPGFRFYPTDEELVGFYLKRKVEKRTMSLELIKQIDIYKYDPWDLPKASSTEGDNNEWYFYCKRGRKYRNSVRPNRVTGSGFWKATGIDKPIYSGDRGDHQLGRRDCCIIGLKKSLVYYRGNAGKGTKTDWMMHEFRLPDLPNAKSNALEAEVWTLCRIFKRNVSYRKYTSNWREISTCKKTPLKSMDTTTATSSKTCSMESANQEGGYISFSSPDDLTTMIIDVPQTDKKFSVMDGYDSSSEKQLNQLVGPQLLSSSIIPSQPPFMASASSSFSNLDGKNEFYTQDDNWDELSSVLGFSHRSSR